MIGRRALLAGIAGGVLLPAITLHREAVRVLAGTTPGDEVIE